MANKGQKYTKTASVVKEHLGEILKSIESGESIEDTATQYGLTRSGLYKHLSTKHSNDYRASLDARADHLADRMLEIASDERVDVARARNMINSIQFTLSRRHSNLYGDRVQQTIEHTSRSQPVINITLSSPGSVAIEGEVIDSSASSLKLDSELRVHKSVEDCK